MHATSRATVNKLLKRSPFSVMVTSCFVARGRREGASWTVSKASIYKGAALPRDANTGGAALEGCSHGRTRTDRNQRANSFGPNELRAIATSGDTMLFGWDFRRLPSCEPGDPGGAAHANDPPASH
jgi:hypothetical protein